MELDSSWSSRAVSAEDAVAHIPSGARVFVHGAAATPTPLLDALAARRDASGLRIYHLHTQGSASCFDPEVASRLRSVSMFVGADARLAVADGRADFMPVFLSDIPHLFSSGAIPHFSTGIPTPEVSCISGSIGMRSNAATFRRPSPHTNATSTTFS